MDGASDLAGWRWIFILERITTVLFSGLAFVLPPSQHRIGDILGGRRKSIYPYVLSIQASIFVHQQMTVTRSGPFPIRRKWHPRPFCCSRYTLRFQRHGEAGQGRRNQGIRWRATHGSSRGVVRVEVIQGELVPNVYSCTTDLRCAFSRYYRYSDVVDRHCVFRSLGQFVLVFAVLVGDL